MQAPAALLLLGLDCRVINVRTVALRVIIREESVAKSRLKVSATRGLARNAHVGTAVVRRSELYFSSFLFRISLQIQHARRELLKS